MPDTQGLRGIAQDPFPHLAAQPKWLEDIKKKKIKKKNTAQNLSRMRSENMSH